MAVAVGDKPTSYGQRYAPENQEFMPDNQSGESHEADAAEGDGGAGSYAADDGAKGWPEY